MGSNCYFHHIYISIGFFLLSATKKKKIGGNYGVMQDDNFCVVSFVVETSFNLKHNTVLTE